MPSTFASLRPQPVDDLVGAGLALVARLQGDEEAAGVDASESPPAPTDEATLATSGIAGDDVGERAAGGDHHAAKEMSCAASVMPMMRPVSCCGKKPLGITMT